VHPVQISAPLNPPPSLALELTGALVGGGVIVLGAAMPATLGAVPTLAPMRPSCVLRISASSFCFETYEVPTGVGGARGRDWVMVGRPMGTYEEVWKARGSDLAQG
jgi:hypothetical protein